VRAARRASTLARVATLARGRSQEVEEKVEIVTSETPHKVSWMSRVETCRLARLGLCTAPGKRTNGPGRDGRQYERSLAEDLRQLDEQGVSLVVCLLNQSELLLLGVQLEEYKRLCAELGIHFLHLPCIEMAPFDCVHEINEACCRVDSELTRSPRNRVVVHCRGGVGRAGAFAACFVLHAQYADAMAEEPRQWGFGGEGGKRYVAADAIAHVRKYRCARALETRRQEEFVGKYLQLLKYQEQDRKLRQRVHKAEAEVRAWDPVVQELCGARAELDRTSSTATTPGDLGNPPLGPLGDTPTEVHCPGDDPGTPWFRDHAEALET